MLRSSTYLTIEFENQPEHTVSCWVLGTKVQHQVGDKFLTNGFCLQKRKDGALKLKQTSRSSTCFNNEMMIQFYKVRHNTDVLSDNTGRTEPDRKEQTYNKVESGAGIGIVKHYQKIGFWYLLHYCGSFWLPCGRLLPWEQSLSPLEKCPPVSQTGKWLCLQGRKLPTPWTSMACLQYSTHHPHPIWLSFHRDTGQCQSFQPVCPEASWAGSLCQPHSLAGAEDNCEGKQEAKNLSKRSCTAP